jgi:hypothetical protein
VSATNPQPDDPRTPGRSAGAEDLKRGGRKVLLAFVAFIIVVAVAGGGPHHPSGGGEEGLGPSVTLELPAAP